MGRKTKPPMPSEFEARQSSSFVQFNRGSMAAYRALIRRSSIAAELITVFTHHMGRDNSLVCSYRTLQDLTGYSRASLSKAVQILKEDQWIQVLKIGTANAYIVNSAAFWSGSAQGKYFAKFRATVLTSAEEQNERLEQMKTLKLKQAPVQLVDGEHVILDDEELPPPDQQDIAFT